MAITLQFLFKTVLPQIFMGKDKKKRSKKDLASENILDTAALTLKKFRKVTKLIAKLSTGQKLVGGVALMAAGLTYLATRETEVDETTANHHRHDHHHHGHLKESATGPNFSTEELVATRHHSTSAATREPRKNLKA